MRPGALASKLAAQYLVTEDDYGRRDIVWELRILAELGHPPGQAIERAAVRQAAQTTNRIRKRQACMPRLGSSVLRLACMFISMPDIRHRPASPNYEATDLKTRTQQSAPR
jgi:hypothetical protein